MSINVDGVKLKTKSKNRLFAGGLILLQITLSVFVYISLAAHMLWPEKSTAVAGVSQMISYEGYLTNTSGSPLGGTGEPYCFRFSIYDNPNLGQGTKLWPAGSPATTMATATDGVFNALVGQADSLTYNFYDNDSVYLNVEVNTSTSTCAGSWETLGPRQQIAASGYSLASESVYGDILRTDISNGRAQIGTGAGGASPKFLGLDVKNTTDYVGASCTTSGTVWYNSAISKALVCENSTIQALSNAGTSTIAAITTNDGSLGYATTGTLVFSNSNGVTFGINGNTITASVAAGGGAGTISSYVNQLPASTGSQTLGAMGVTSGSAQFYPVSIASNVAFNALRVAMNFSYVTSAVSGRQTLSHSFGLYSLNGSTLSQISSGGLTYRITNSGVSATLSAATATATTGYGYGSITASTTAQIHSLFGTRGLRAIDLQFGNTMSLSAGVYWLGFLRRESSSSANVGLSIGLAGNVMLPVNAMGKIGNHSDSLTTNFALKAPYLGFGPYTSTGSAGYGGTALPSSVFISGIAHTGSNMPFMTFLST